MKYGRSDNRWAIPLDPCFYCKFVWSTSESKHFFPFFCRFLLQCLEDLDANLRKLNSRLFVIRGQPADVFPRLFKVNARNTYNWNPGFLLPYILFLSIHMTVKLVSTGSISCSSILKCKLLSMQMLKHFCSFRVVFFNIWISLPLYCAYHQLTQVLLRLYSFNFFFLSRNRISLSCFAVYRSWSKFSFWVPCEKNACVNAEIQSLTCKSSA